MKKVLAALGTGSDTIKFSADYPLEGCLLPLREILSVLKCVDLGRTRWNRAEAGAGSSRWI